MEREPNTDAQGRRFTPEIIEVVWQKARRIGIYETLRADAWGWTILRQDFGNRSSRYGWEIDHIVPVSHGGTDDLLNLQPLQWENNRRKDEIQGALTDDEKANPIASQKHDQTTHIRRHKKH